MKSALRFENSLLTTRIIKDAYDGVKHLMPSLSIPHSCGNDDQWAEFLTELYATQNLDAVFCKYGVSGNLESGWNQYAYGNAFVNWIYFIQLKLNATRLENSYLRFVLENTVSFNSFTHNIIYAITEINHADRRFNRFYSERKLLIDKFTDADIADFVVANRKNLAETIYNLTDTKLSEREEIIACYSKSASQVEHHRAVAAYPLLGEYLRHYSFDCGKLSMLYTQYFEDYKHQKISNKVDSKFLEQVVELAHKREYNRLPTRNELFNKFDKNDTYLYWLDAFGVEFLGFVQAKCKELGLGIIIHVAQAQLPTNTSTNRDFYDEWQGQKEHDMRLDEIKHKSSGYDYQNNKLPIHIAKELDIIDDVLSKVATMLALHYHKKVLIASDHGASRLAVINEQEEKYETDTKGEHSGRCCRYFKVDDLPFAAESNGYWVLADYGRFKGSRAANVEVHGGASLEEVMVPVIELTLKHENSKVELAETTITSSFRKKSIITVFSKSRLENISVVINGKRYKATKVSDNHHEVLLEGIRRAGDYYADVFEGDNFIERLHFIIQTESGKKNDAFDDLF